MTKWLDFSLKDVRVLGINFGFAKLEPLLLEKALTPPLLLSLICESKQIQGIHIDSCDTISVEQYLCQDCWGPASKSNNLEAYLTTLKQTSLFMVSSSILGVFCWKLEGTAYPEESFCCRDSQSALQLRFPGKCSAVIVISYPSRNCLISFEICISSWFFVPPIFSK